MSYKITCYFQDSCIETTTIYVPYIGQTYTGDYGDDYKSVSGLTDSWTSRFTATPADGCEFTRWVYRIGSTTASVQYSYANPFTYSGGGDIYIRAEGAVIGGEPDEPDEPEESWSLTTGTIGTLSELYSKSISMSAYRVYRYSVKFQNSGSATFYTTGSVDTYGYLTTTTAYDESTGKPTSYRARDDDSGDSTNFEITYDVTAGTTYYIWVKSYDGTDTGSVYLYISPPPSENRPSNFSWTYAKTQGGTYNLKASEWNALTDKINAFRAYCGLSDYSFDTAYVGDNFTAYMYNQARAAIQGIEGYGSYIPIASQNQTVTAYMLNTLVSELNAIP